MLIFLQSLTTFERKNKMNYNLTIHEMNTAKTTSSKTVVNKKNTREAKVNYLISNKLQVKFTCHATKHILHQQEKILHQKII